MKNDLVTDFLYYGKGRGGGMPDDSIIIRTDFEADCYEDWGFVVERLKWVKNENGVGLYSKHIISAGSNLRKAIENAKKEFT